MNFIRTFLYFLGAQNGSLFPMKKINDNRPFKKPHLWKTRYGFKSAWNLADELTIN